MKDMPTFQDVKEIIMNSVLPSNGRVGDFSLDAEVTGISAVKVVALDNEALSHINDPGLTLTIMPKTNFTSHGSLGATVCNSDLGGGRYGLSFYKAEGGNLSSQVVTDPLNVVKSAAIGAVWVGNDGIYILGNAGYKWRPRTYSYSLTW